MSGIGYWKEGEYKSVTKETFEAGQAAAPSLETLRSAGHNVICPTAHLHSFFFPYCIPRIMFKSASESYKLISAVAKSHSTQSVSVVIRRARPSAPALRKASVRPFQKRPHVSWKLSRGKDQKTRPAPGAVVWLQVGPIPELGRVSYTPTPSSEHGNTIYLGKRHF